MAKALALKIILVRVTPSAEEYHRYMSAMPISAAATVYLGPYEEFAKKSDAQAMQYLHSITEKLNREHLATVEQVLHGRSMRKKGRPDSPRKVSSSRPAISRSI